MRSAGQPGYKKISKRQQKSKIRKDKQDTKRQKARKNVVGSQKQMEEKSSSKSKIKICKIAQSNIE